MKQDEILKEIESLKFSLRMNELRTYSDSQEYKRCSDRLEELTKKLDGGKNDNL